MIFYNTRYFSMLLKSFFAALIIIILSLLLISITFAKKWYDENIELKIELRELKGKIRQEEDEEEIFRKACEKAERDGKEMLDFIEKDKQRIIEEQEK